MYGVFVICKVKPGREEEFLAAARGDREGTRTEPGNLRFDILRPAPAPDATPTEEGQPTVFYLFEVYRSAEDFALHQQTPHYFRFRDDVADLMAEPRQGLRYVPVEADPWE